MNTLPAVYRDYTRSPSGILMYKISEGQETGAIAPAPENARKII
jgi:hypothetical protein